MFLEIRGQIWGQGEEGRKPFALPGIENRKLRAVVTDSKFLDSPK